MVLELCACLGDKLTLQGGTVISTMVLPETLQFVGDV